MISINEINEYLTALQQVPPDRRDDFWHAKYKLFSALKNIYDKKKGYTK